jgi:hypothetical protein
MLHFSERNNYVLRIGGHRPACKMLEPLLPIMNTKQETPVPALRYCVGWRPYLWLRPLEYALGDPARFAGKRVLDLGCRFGRRYDGLLALFRSNFERSTAEMLGPRLFYPGWQAELVPNL